MSNVDFEGSHRQKSIEMERLTDRPSYFDTWRRELTSRVVVEYCVSFILVSLAFVLSTLLFLNENVQSLVPFSSLHSCSTHSEVFSLVPQTVELTYPATIAFVNYGTGRVSPGQGNVTFTAKWESCFIESVDNNFRLEPETDDYYQPVTITVAGASAGRFNGTASTNDGCFQLFCGAEYTYDVNQNLRKNFQPFMKDSIFILIPYNAKIEVDVVNGTGTYVNNQLITSISGTDNSVTASCAVSIGGYYLQIFTQSNSVTTTGTYVCTQPTSALQAVSSGLSIALAAVGLCRMYFLSKAHFAAKKK